MGRWMNQPGAYVACPCPGRPTNKPPRKGVNMLTPEEKEIIAEILAIPVFFIVFFALFVIGWAFMLPPV
jgi:hypothetical protein